MFQTQKVGSRFITYALSRCQIFKTNTKLLAAVESFKVTLKVKLKVRFSKLMTSKDIFENNNRNNIFDRNRFD
jgi:hypothetical protein